MKAAHVNSKEAVKIHKDLGSTRSVGIHFETFQLTAEPFEQPRKALKEELVRQKIASSKFIAPIFGEFYEI